MSLYRIAILCALCVLQPALASAQLVISEFRLRGPNGGNDEFIEIYNRANGSVTVSAISGTGYGIAASDGTTRCSIPNGTMIPARGHFLCVNSTFYSLGAYPAGNGTNATGDATYTTDIPDNAGIALFNNNTGGGSYILANRLDAVGPTSEANTLYKEGTGYPALTPFSIDYSFTRRVPGGCIGFTAPCNSVLLLQTRSGPNTIALVDTNNNATDFIFVDTNGTSAGAGQRLGSPGPENLSSPISSDGTSLSMSRIDSSRPYNMPPNYIRDNTSDPFNSATFGKLDIRQRFTNNSGGSITRLRFRILDITTFPAASNMADLRPLTSSDAGSVHGTTLETPPSQPNGAGFNGTLSVGSITLGTPLANGASVDVRFLMGIQQIGAARFCVAAETLPAVSSPVFCFIHPTEGVVTETSRTFSNNAAISIPDGGPSGAPATPYPSTVTVFGITNPVTRITVTLKQLSHTWPDDIDVLLVGPTGVKFVLMSDAMSSDDVPSRTYTFDDRAMAPLADAVSQNTGSYKPVNYEGIDGFPSPAPAGPYLSPSVDVNDSLTSAFNGVNPNGTWNLYVVDDAAVDSGSIAGGWDLTIISSCTAPLGTIRSDPNGDCKSDLTVFRPSSGQWFSTGGQAPVQFGLPGDIPVAGDYNGDGFMEFAVYRPSSGYWFAQGQGAVQWGLLGDIPVPGDYNSDGMTDPAVFRPSTGQWFIRNQSTVQWGLPGDIPLPGDYDNDPETDLVVYRPSTGTWFVQGQSSEQWGLPGDIPVPGDYDGDRKMDFAVYRPSNGTWYISTTSSADIVKQWGLPGDLAMPIDYDGDLEMDLALYRPSNGTWYILPSTTNYSGSFETHWGLSSDMPISYATIAYAITRRSTLATLARVSDFDADRLSDLTVFRPSNATWFTLRSTSDYATSGSVQWGLNGDLPIPHDYDGDGQTDFAVYRPSTGGWHFLRSTSGYTTSTSLAWGLSGDVPMPGDYDGDGVTDPAVYRPSTGNWHILFSGAGYTTQAVYQWGVAGDVPQAGDFDGDAISDLTVYRPSNGTWFTRYSSTGYTTWASRQWGLGGDIPVPGEYDADGKTDHAVYRPSTGEWLILRSSTNQTASSYYQWGLSGDVPVPGDFDGDRKTDVAVWRPSNATWYLLLSSTNFSVFDQVQWGLSSDIPILKRP